MNTESQFWKMVDKSGACWRWTAGKTAAGYGSLAWHGKTALAHRLAWEFTMGPIPIGLYVCHRCDVCDCVNPAHLFLGTQRDNLQDMVRKGRHRGPKPSDHLRGEAHPAAKLTEELVRILRAAPKGKISETARALGVNKWTAFDAVKRRWKHITA